MIKILTNPYVRIAIGAALSTYGTVRVLSYFAPGLGIVINPETGHQAVSDPEKADIARQAAIGTGAAITTVTFVLLGMLGGKSAAAAAAGSGTPAAT